MKLIYPSLLSAVALGTWPIMAQEALYIDAGSRGHDINPDMYGIFFEEINHSGDGGLYAELIQNRGFEEQTIPGGFSQIGTNKIQTPEFTVYHDLSRRQLTWDWDFNTKKMTGWNLDCDKCSIDYDVVTPDLPLHEATPNAMRLTIRDSQSGSTARLINSGYWGIAVERDADYDLRFYLRTSDYHGRIRAVILDAAGNNEIASASFDTDDSDNWKEYKAVLKANTSVDDAQFALVFEGDGTLYIDYVSLFPQATFNNRPNGLRPDIAQILVELQPKFMRWPGGCIVEGIVLDNRVRWKETLGDPMTRPGQYDLWGYRSSWGMGYHEILQFCEDAGMDCMFVGNAGLSCVGWGGEYVTPGSDLDPYYVDIRDAIEYAIGDPTTNEWAARRAEAGHPEPFPLKYVEIGNENFSKRYDDNYKYIYERLKKEYPQLTFLNTMGIEHAAEFDVHTDMIDPHWYVAPEFFYNNRTIFDNVPRGNYNIYVGEYAANVHVGQGNMDASLSEAVFMMDMERNSDIVKMASYAPLITNDHAPNWTCNLIWQHSGDVFGRASYYVQKLFSENLPSFNLPFSLQTERAAIPYHGRMGVGTWLTSARFRNIKVSTPEGEHIYTSDFEGARNEWSEMQGSWSLDSDGSYSQGNAVTTRCISLMNTLAFRDCVIELQACKTTGQEGFLIVFGADDEDWNHYYQFNIGGWNNTMVGFEEVSDGVGTVISERPSLKIENNRWYDIKLVCANGRIEGYIDNQLYCSCDFGNTLTGRVSAHAGYDETNGEMVVKVVNAEADSMPLTLHINALDIASNGEKITLKSETLWDENSFSMPTAIAPVTETISGIESGMKMDFDPYSLTILRFKATPAAEPMEFPEYKFSSTPRILDNTNENKALQLLRQTVAEAESVAFPDVEGFEALQTTLIEAHRVLNSGDDTTFATATETLRQALNTYYRLQMIDDNEVTGKIINAHFEKEGDNTGWSGNLTVRDHVAEIFNTGFNISQTVEGLDNGYYMVYFQGYYRNGNHPDAHARHADGSEQLLTTFSLNTLSKPVVSLMGEVHNNYWWSAPNSMAEAHQVFSQNSDNYANYLIAEVTDGTLNISLNKSTLCDSDWFCFDNVRLFKIPTAGSGIDLLSGDFTSFSPSARIYDLQGRFAGTYAGLRRLSPGIYIITEGAQSLRIRIN